MKTGLVLFSGGVDSTYLVTRCVQDFDKLILNTYRTPGMVKVGASKRSAEQLKKIYENKIEHNIIDIRDFVGLNRGGIIKCIQDNMKYGFFYSWCLGCKVSMHLYTIDYCKKNGITYVLDGSNYYDVHALEQHEDVKELLKNIYKEAGIEFSAPAYYEKGIPFIKDRAKGLLRHLSLFKDSTEYRVKYLEKTGIHLGKGFLSQYRHTQPSCTVSVMFNLIRVPLKLIFGEKAGCCQGKEGYLGYITDKACMHIRKKRGS